MVMHTMGLYETPFQSMKTGRKTIEVRLNDPKRRKVNIGDLIKFTKLPDQTEQLTVEVVGLQEFANFREMYETIPAEHFDASERSIEDMVKNTYEIYTQSQEQQWGSLAIKVKLRS